ncbi:MAG: HlyD family efflux transporter periplasmic adaptor subunit [Thermoanaerobaculia bacterium]
MRLTNAAAVPSPEADLAVHVVDVGSVEIVLKETGVVRPRQSVAVKSKVSGRVREIGVAEGENVRAGQLVAVVEPDAQASLTVLEKRLELRRLKLDRDQKERVSKRLARLAKEGLSSEQSAEEAERDFLTAQNLFLQARTVLNVLEKEANQPESKSDEALGADPRGLTDYRILAPIAGVVASVKVKPGELATSGTTGFSQEGALLMEIADQSQLEVAVNLNEIDVPKVKRGMHAKVTLAARPGKPLDSVVDRVGVAPFVDTTRASGDAAKTVVYQVALRLPERPEELRQGMTAMVDLTLESRAKVTRIPVLAFEEKDGKVLVRRKAAVTASRPSSSAFEDVAIELGLRGERFVEVTKGLEPKDVIVARWPREPVKKK